ncbi:MAG: CAP domain-containing protein [Actinobacteria bacterium]|nr:CAP domain-containing protein [Actinomycetota bacterium]
MTVAGPARGEQELAGLEMAYEIFDRVNDERATRGLQGLDWDPGLETKADEWSRDMSVNGFRHGGYLRVDTGQFPGLGENIARATGKSLLNAGVFHSGWMNSDGHRENILNQGFDAVGISVYCVGNNLWATQIFGRRAGSSRPPLTDGVPPRDPIVWPDPGGPSC